MLHPLAERLAKEGDGSAVVPEVGRYGCAPVGGYVTMVVRSKVGQVIGDGLRFGTFTPSSLAQGAQNQAYESTQNQTNLWNGFVGNGSPKIVRSEGLGAVPVWFVPVEPLMAFITAQGPDPVLTLHDLAAIGGRINGLATHLREVLNPHPAPPDMLGGHPNPSLNLTARGTLDDGRTFHLNLRGRETADGWQRTTQIRFP